MHALLHIVAAVLVLPYVALACLFLLIGEAARTKGLLALLDVALHHASWFARWGMYVIPLLWLLLAAAGMIAPFKRPGALALGLLAAGSLVVIITLDSSRMDLGQVLFLAPCLAVVVMSVWLFVRAGNIG